MKKLVITRTYYPVDDEWLAKFMRELIKQRFADVAFDLESNNFATNLTIVDNNVNRVTSYHIQPLEQNKIKAKKV